MVDSSIEMLDKVPEEVLGVIVHKVADQADLKSLCEVSKRVSDVATPRLYESIILQAGDIYNLDNLKSRLDTMPAHMLHYTKHVRIKSPLRGRLSRRCPPHHAIDYESLGNDLDADEDPFVNLQTKLDSFLYHLKEDQLLSFSWDIGMCFPGKNFGIHGGALSKKQKRLEKISLITDHSCEADNHHLIHLTEFKHLKSLSWLGLNKGYHYWSFREFVQNNKLGVEGLQSLTLDLIGWRRAEGAYFVHERAIQGGNTYQPNNFFAEILLGLSPEDSDFSEADEEENTETVLFKSLDFLSLSAISFEREEIHMIRALNILNLTTLKLVNCHCCLPMLRTLVEMGQSIALKSFELVVDDPILRAHESQYFWNGETQEEIISSLLNSFSGLEDIFLMLAMDEDRWDSISLAVANHAMTLKRLVMHKRAFKYYDQYLDGQINLSPGIRNLLSKTSFSCLGTNIPPWELEARIHSLADKPTLKILHLRSSGVDEETREEIALDQLYFSSRSKLVDDSIDYENESKSEAARDQSATSRTEQVQTTGSPPTMEDLSLRPIIDYPFKNISRAQAIANGTFKQGKWIVDLLPFANWAFSKDGLPDLRILAWGDFSKDGRWTDQNILLCRDESLVETRGVNFRELWDTDMYYWDLIDANMDMLGACPTATILR